MIVLRPGAFHCLSDDWKADQCHGQIELIAKLWITLEGVLKTKDEGKVCFT
jgi:hypothetical protein